MLIKRDVLERISAGEIDVLFRRQKRPTVKVGGTLRTSVGVLEILAVDPIDLASITDDDARRAGFDDATAIREELGRKPEGTDYRVTVTLGGPDPRLALRESDDLDDEELERVTAQLDRFDHRSPRGPWTSAFLDVIDRNPHIRAPDLAAELGWETAAFKGNVRKLKELGLTISHSPGYELSPRGRTVLAVLRRG